MSPNQQQQAQQNVPQISNINQSFVEREEMKHFDSGGSAAMSYSEALDFTQRNIEL